MGFSVWNITYNKIGYRKRVNEEYILFLIVQALIAL